jgi:hypothetical protein
MSDDNAVGHGSGFEGLPMPKRSDPQWWNDPLEFMRKEQQRSNPQEHYTHGFPDESERENNPQEWTEDYIRQLSQISSGDGFLRIANARNAALAAEREETTRWVIEAHASAKELAAERERNKTLVDFLLDARESILNYGDNFRVTVGAIDAALAKAKEQPNGT